MAIFDAEEIETKESKWSETLGSVLGCLLYLVFGLAGIVVIVLLIRGVPWIAENVYPTVSIICALLLLILVPVSIVLSIFRKTRPWGGLGFTLSSYALGLTLWLWSLIVAYVLAGMVWMIVGLLFAGVGVVFIAFAASLLSGEWAEAIQLGVMTLLVYVFRGVGAYFVEGKKEEDYGDVDSGDSNQYDEIVSDYGLYIENNPLPPIGDAGKLPHSRDEILKAMEWKEQQLCDRANFAKKYELPDLPEIERYLGAVQSTKFMLTRFAYIDPEDQDEVDYFNSFGSLPQIPRDEFPEYFELSRKYLDRASRDFGIESDFSKEAKADAPSRRILKYCTACDEGFAERFLFCPNCGGGLEAHELKRIRTPEDEQ